MDKLKPRKRETTHNIEFNIYRILFLSIKCIVVYTRFLSMVVFQWYFWIWFQFKNIFDFIIKNKSSVIKKKIDCTYIKPPQEITVVLNETNLREREVYDLFYMIAEFFSSIKVGKLNFYQQKGFSYDTIRKLKENFGYEDKNNNPISLNDYKNLKIRNNKILDISNMQKDENNKIIVNFLSNSNAGKLFLIDACKDIAKMVQNKDLMIQDIDKDLISKRLTEECIIKDPELLICIGPNDTLAGYSPWHLRLTEIIKISSHKIINQRSLLDIIEKYNKIEKRLGK